MKAIADCRLYTFIDSAYLNGRSPGELARALCGGGSDIIQVRAKGFASDAVQRLVEEVLPITNTAGVPLVVNDHLDVARSTGAAWCHLGQEDFFDAGLKHIRELELKSPHSPSGSILIGLSSHAPDQANRAVQAGAHYVAIGPVYATGTKPGAKPVTLDYVQWAAKNLAVPWFAIGGINLKTLADVIEAGAQRICVVSAILNAPDVEKECLRYRAALDLS